jgi:hypothetical protein
MALRANRPTTKHKLEALLQSIEALRPCRNISMSSQHNLDAFNHPYPATTLSTVRSWDERQLYDLLAVLQPVVSPAAPLHQKLYHDVCNQLGKEPLTNLYTRLHAWHTNTTQLTNQANTHNKPTTWTQQLRTILTQLLHDINTLKNAYRPVVVPYTIPNQDIESETRNLKAERDLHIETSQDYTAETYLHLLLHMFDVPRKHFTYTTHMKQDFDDPNKREKIQDFYPHQHNYYIDLYTDTQHHRDHFQSQPNIKELLNHCAVYLLIHERPVGSTNSLLVDQRATNLYCVLSVLKA